MDATQGDNPFDNSSASGDKPYHNFGVDNGDDYPTCEKAIIDDGELVIVSAMDKAGTQRVVTAMQANGFRVDWHWQSSRMCIKAVRGQDVAKMREVVRAATEQFHRELDNDIRRLNETHNKTQLKP